MADTHVTNNESESRWEIRLGGDLVGFAAYQRTPDEIVFTHTEIDDAYEGQGLGSRLARGALDDARARGLKVRPLCPFIRGWIKRHPDYADLVV